MKKEGWKQVWESGGEGRKQNIREWLVGDVTGDSLGDETPPGE